MFPSKGDRWALNHDACISCGRSDIKHGGHGLCTVCYRKSLRQRDLAAREDPVVTNTDPIDPPPVEPVLDGATADDVGEERRPGLHTSPVSDDGAPPPGTQKRRSWRNPFVKAETPPPGPEAPRTDEKRPTRPHRRVSGAETISDAWGFVGGAAMRSRRYYPVGNCLVWQAPLAGEMVDEALKGSPVDKAVLQPIVRARARFDLIGAVAGPPLIVLAIIQQPNRVNVLMPVLRQAIDGALPYMVPAMKKAEKRWAEKLNAIKELYPDLEIPEGTDPVDLIIQQMFAGYDLGVQHGEAEAAQEEGVPQ